MEIDQFNKDMEAAYKRIKDDLKGEAADLCDTCKRIVHLLEPDIHGRESVLVFNKRIYDDGTGNLPRICFQSCEIRSGCLAKDLVESIISN